MGFADHDAEVVGSVTRWAQWGQDSTFAPQTITTATPTLYFSATTPVLAAGWYKIDPVVLFTGSNSGTGISSFLVIGGFTFDTIFTEAAVPGGGFLFSGAIAMDFTAGDAAHTIETWFSHSSGPGSVTAVFSQIQWERKA